MGIYITLSVILFLSLIAWARNKEKEIWNGGYSRKTGERWIYFDTDSQGGRGYKTKSGSDWCWISYAVDR